MENVSIADQKSVLRKRARLELKKYFEDKALGLQCAETVADYFLKSKEYAEAQIIFAYMALSDEVDLSLIIKKALDDKKKVALPRMSDDSGEMDFYFIDSLEDSFSDDNKFGISEPSGKNKKVEPEKIPEKCVFLVPGLVFNLEGARLGRGKGYYDRYLNRIPHENHIFCGVCTVNVVTKAVPVEKSDFRMNYLLTEYGFIRTKVSSAGS